MIYNLVIYIYLFGVKLAALFSSKPAKMVKGHREVFDILRDKIDRNARYIWFHAASLGEFEQGRPLIERIRKEHPEYRIHFIRKVFRFIVFRLYSARIRFFSVGMVRITVKC